MVTKNFLNRPAIKQQLLGKSARRRSAHAAATRIADLASHPGRNDVQPNMKSIWLPIGALKPSAKRARITTPEQLERVINSIRQFGVVMQILIDRNNRIVAGHVLWEAAKRLGIDEIECRMIEHLDDVELEALTLALNRLGETGTWDLDILRERMIEIRTGGIELTNTGFTLQETDQILLDPLTPEACDDEECDADAAEAPVSILGDLFQLGDHRLLCGDALEIASYERVLDERQAQMVFSDAPYNCPVAGFVSGLGKHKHGDFQMASGEMDCASFTTFLTTYLEHCRSVTSEGAVVFACMDWRQIDRLLEASRKAGLTRNNICTWHKGSAMGGLYRNATEFVAVFVNGPKPATNNVQLGAHGRDRSNLWAYAGANRKGSSSAEALSDHPTPKPVPMVEDCLLDVTNPGDVVLDPFSGSGTTICAAENCGRIARGIELDPKYVDRSIRRWERMTGREATHAETGLTFAELTVSRQATEQE